MAERIDDLQRSGLLIIQDDAGFCFGMDAVLLAGFANVKEGDRVLDLCTGTGVVPLLLKGRTKGKEFFGLELQEHVADMAARSVELNHLEDTVHIVQGDVKEASKFFGNACFDVVTVNPPYMKAQHGLVNPDSWKAISRHELFCTLEDVLKQSAAVLKSGGRFYMVHRPMRLVEMITLMHQVGIEPKRMRFVHPYAGKEANMILIEGIRGGGAECRIEPPLIVYKEPGVYSDEIHNIYEV